MRDKKICVRFVLHVRDKKNGDDKVLMCEKVVPLGREEFVIMYRI